MAAETKRVVDDNVHPHLAGLVRNVVEIALRIGVVEIDRGWRDIGF